MHCFPDDESGKAKSFDSEESALAVRFTEEHYDAIYRYCARRLNSKEDAQDATQEVFLRLVSSKALYVEQGKPLAYLYTCARHVCADFSKNRKPANASLEDCEIDVSDRAQGRMERHLVMEDALSRLTVEEREVLELRYGQDLTMAEIAAVTGKSRFALYRTERKALRALRNLLGGGND